MFPLQTNPIVVPETARDEAEAAESRGALLPSSHPVQRVLEAISRALPEIGPDCLHLVDQSSLPAGAECQCRRCGVEREMIRQKRLGPSCNIVAGRRVA
jgi:hypothetical protein